MIALIASAFAVAIIIPVIVERQPTQTLITPMICIFSLLVALIMILYIIDKKRLEIK